VSKNRKQILIPLAITLALLTIGAVICLAAIDVGSGAPNEGLTSRFQNAFFRNGFAYLVSLPPVNNVQRFGSTGLIQEFNSRESAGTGGTPNAGPRLAICSAVILDLLGSGGHTAMK